MTDKEFLQLMETSPREAHLALIDKYGDLVYAVVLSKLGSCASREEIEDCVSDAFVEVFRSTYKYDSEKGSLKGFVSTIAKHTAINAFQRITYRRNQTMYIEDEPTELPPSGEDPPDDALQKKQFHMRLWEIVASLGEPDTSIIIYQYYYDLKIREISKKLSMTTASVQKRSLRARERIRKILKEENYI